MSNVFDNSTVGPVDDEIDARAMNFSPDPKLPEQEGAHGCLNYFLLGNQMIYCQANHHVPGRKHWALLTQKGTQNTARLEWE